MWDWQIHNNGADLLLDADALESYLVTQGTTPLNEIPLKAQVYIAVFELGGKRKVARLVVADKVMRRVAVSF
jgi:hypothetical protein